MAHKNKSKGTTASMDGMYEQYKAEDDARTLIRAQEIVADKSRITKARSKLKEQIMATRKAVEFAGNK